MENEPSPVCRKPEILAPAGDPDCFLAALAAGADAVYLGLKNFSARMEAENFSLATLGRLLALAHNEKRRVYVAMNNLIRQEELEQAFRLVCRLGEQVPVDGLIVQDIAMLAIARQANFAGTIALSTLANVCNGYEVVAAAGLGAARVILPRELNVDEMRQIGQACPGGMELECFVHGALCYCVSGRCYWSSYMGGRSGLRGRCTQPCRRLYAREHAQAKKSSSDRGRRLFACQDLELAPVFRQLFTVPNLVSWKIEGRKKGPHYVFYAVTAYKLLRDNPDDPQARKEAKSLLEQALGRPGVRAGFIARNHRQPMAPDGQTASGLLAGVIRMQPNGTCTIKPHFALLPRDLLRVGTEDERWHETLPVTKGTPKGGTLVLRLPRHKTPPNGTPVYLIDRREPQLLGLLRDWREKLEQIPEISVQPVARKLALPKAVKAQTRPDIFVHWHAPRGKSQNRGLIGLWLSAKTAEISRTLYERASFWLPPAIWPEDAQAFTNLVDRLMRRGARHFTLNSAWQRGFFPDSLPENMDLVAGPFCNIANSLTLQTLADLNFRAAFISPELSAGDILALPKQSPLPLGMVIAGAWPVGLSRFGLAGLNVNEPFKSPKGEIFYARNHSGTYWIYPSWPINLLEKRKQLTAAGYSFFAFLEEDMPDMDKSRERPGLFNWDNRLL